jgi:hypothetical protein
MNQFTFEDKQKKVLIAGMIIGLISLVLTYISDDQFHSRFWSNFLHNSVFFTGIGFLALFLLSAKLLAYSGWHTVFKRIWESFSLFLMVGIVLMAIIVAGLWGHLHHLYHWSDAEAVAADPILAGKSSFLNPMMYTIFTIGVVGVWIYFSLKIRKNSLDEDANGGVGNYTFYKKNKILGGIFLPVGGFTSAAMVWLWVMSVDAHWYSTLFAWYSTASWFVSMLALTILLIYYLKGKGYYTQITNEHLHDLGKYLFAFSIFWTYLWFSQYMLIWYANVGEETVYFQTRMQEYPVLFYANLAINFFLPFLVLIRNDNKRKAGAMIFVSIMVFVGHWIDFFQMIKPGVAITAAEAAHHLGGGEGAAHGHDVMHTMQAGFTLPGFLEIGTLIGFLCLFLYVFFMRLGQAALVPKNDPFLEESLHHHV